MRLGLGNDAVHRFGKSLGVVSGLDITGNETQSLAGGFAGRYSAADEFLGIHDLAFSFVRCAPGEMHGPCHQR
jgi:hypothetical protein